MMSRMEKFGSRSSRAQNGLEPPQHEKDTNKLPPRHVAHPSNRTKLTKLFYNSLIFIFILLVAGLLVWGNSYADHG